MIARSQGTSSYTGQSISPAAASFTPAEVLLNPGSRENEILVLRTLRLLLITRCSLGNFPRRVIATLGPLGAVDSGGGKWIRPHFRGVLLNPLSNSKSPSAQGTGGAVKHIDEATEQVDHAQVSGDRTPEPREYGQRPRHVSD